MHVLLVTPLVLSALTGQAYAGARVSHFEKGGKMGANYWAGNNAIDGKKETAWMVPGESENKGEWIELDVPQGTVDKVSIFPGYGKTDETYTDYPRVKQMRVDVFALDDEQNPQQVGTATIDVADKPEVQTFDIPDAKISAGMFGGKVRITVLDVYPGEDYPNLGVSELYVNLKEYDAPTIKLEGLEGGDAGKTPEMVTDNNVKTLWTTQATTATFTVDPGTSGLGSVGIQSAGKDLGRPKTVQVSINGLTQTTVLPDKPGEMQWAACPAFNGFTGGASGAVEVKIVDVYPGTKPGLGIAEVKGHATNSDTL
jgi:hypothetical protein